MRLAIDRLSLDCLVGSDHRDPASARDRLVGLTHRLPASLEQHVRPFAGGDEIVLVRSLALDVVWDPDGSEAAALAQWAQVFAAELGRQLSAQGQGVVRFENRAHQLAVFIRDLVGGDAWSVWFHRPFEGLRALPTARALATALGSDPIRGQAALARLDEIVIAKVGELLDVGVEQVAEALCSDAPDAPETSDLIPTLCEAALRHASSPGPRLLAILKAHAAATDQPCGSRALALCREVVAALEEVGQGVSSAGASEVARASARSNNEAPDGSTGAARAGLTARVRAHAATVRVSRIGTRLGGPLLLLRDLDSVDLQIDTEAPGPEGWSAANAVRALVLARLAGPERERTFFGDPFWRDLLGMPPALDLALFVRWAGRGWPRNAAAREKSAGRVLPWSSQIGLPDAPKHAVAALAGAVLDAFARRLPGFSQSSAAHLQANFLDVRATILRQGEEKLTAFVSRPPLDPILALSGAANWTADFTWTQPARIGVSREPR